MPASDLREQLNTLWKTTVDQFDEIKEVVVHNSHVGRKKLDAAFLKRQRDRLYQDLGELVFAETAAGRMDLAPEGQRVVERLQEVSAKLEAEESSLRDITANPVNAPADDAAPTTAEKQTAPDEPAPDEPAQVVTQTQVAPQAEAVSEPAEVVADTAEKTQKAPQAKLVEPAASELAPAAESAAKKNSQNLKNALDLSAEDGHNGEPVDDADSKPRRRRRRPRKKVEPSED